MTSIGEALRTTLIASTAINGAVSGRVHQNRVPPLQSGSTDIPRIWYQRRAAEYIGTTFDTTGNTSGEPMRTSFDVEVHDTDIDVALDTGLLVMNYLNGHSSTSMTAVFARDHDDDYEPKGTGDEEGIHVAALDIEIIHDST